MSSQKSKEVRRLLSTTLQKRQQKASSSVASRVNHPFAKYDDSNKLICIACSIQIKNSASWNTHLISLGHKESLKRLKGAKEKVVDSSNANKDGNKIKSTILPFNAVKKTGAENVITLLSENDKKRTIETDVNDDNIKELLVEYGSDEGGEEDEQ
ncbi:2983_t:CDS:1, partial [Acaulospora morrowiae]